jgi:hypothetical protein
MAIQRNFERIIGAFSLGLTFLFPALGMSGRPVYAQEPPLTTVTVRKENVGTHVVYHYQVINNSQQAIVTFAVGYDYAEGVAELLVAPLGWDFSNGLPQDSATSPPGWTVRVVTVEESPSLWVEWSSEPEFALLPGQTLEGFSVVVPQANSLYEMAHFDLILDNSTHLSARLRPADGPTFEFTALSPANVWVGLKNSDAVGLRVDLKAEVFLNATKVGEGQLNNVASGSSGFNNAKFNSIPLTLFEPVEVVSGDTLSLTLSVRRTCFGGGHNSGTPRLWFNDSQANSRFGATIEDAASEFFLREGFALSTSAGTSKRSIDVPVDSKAPCPDRPFKPFGTWSLTLP